MNIEKLTSSSSIPPSSEQKQIVATYLNMIQAGKYTSMHQKLTKAYLVYHYLKVALFDTNNYQGPIATPHFEKALNRYFTVLENNPNLDDFERVKTIYQSFGKKERNIHFSDDVIFQKLFPFRQMKSELSINIRDTYHAMYSWLTKP